MFTLESIMLIPKDEIEEVSKSLNADNISQLIESLSLKDDNIRYQALQLLQYRSMYFNDVYQYWDVLCHKLKSDNSYQRSIGLMLIAENIKWDVDNKIEDIIDDYLMLLNDEKPITVRQCIQSLVKIVSFKPSLNDKIASKLISIDLNSIKETMRKLILFDILNVLITIRKIYKAPEIEGYILKALTGEILDKKSKKQIELLL